MAPVKEIKVTELKAILDNMPKDVLLRKINEQKTAEYAERMAQGVTFPPPVIGRYQPTEKYGSQAIVDGAHRIEAAIVAKIPSLPVQIQDYRTVTEMLADMYARNMAHGFPVTEGQRNARIKLLRTQGMTLEAIAKLFALGKSSIDRIAKDEQGEGKSGPKGGAIRSKGQKSQKPRTAKQIHKMLESLNEQFQRTKPNVLSDYISYLTPVTDDDDTEDGQLDEEKFEQVELLLAFLQRIVKEVG